MAMRIPEDSFLQGKLSSKPGHEVSQQTQPQVCRRSVSSSWPTLLPSCPRALVLANCPLSYMLQLCQQVLHSSVSLDFQNWMFQMYVLLTSVAAVQERKSPRALFPKLPKLRGHCQINKPVLSAALTCEREKPFKVNISQQGRGVFSGFAPWKCPGSDAHVY